ncbi:unnamed protein product, partial [Choristocarpus tenellus]
LVQQHSFFWDYNLLMLAFVFAMSFGIVSAVLTSQQSVSLQFRGIFLRPEMVYKKMSPIRPHQFGTDGGDGDLDSLDGKLQSCSVDKSSPPLEILYRDGDGAVVCKPPLMHVHSPTFGSKDKEFVLQKARDQLGQYVYFPHRLDRGTSGCLLIAFTKEGTAALQQALSSPRARKTYVALVRGSGAAYVGRGWFKVDRPIKDSKKKLKNASTRFLFVAGSVDPRCCVVLAQPCTGR